VVVHHLIPDIFHQNHLAQRGGQRDQLLHLVMGALLDHVGRAVAPAAHNDQHTAAAGGVRDAQAVLDVLTALGALFFLVAGESLGPVGVVDRVVDEHAGLAHGVPRLLDRELARLVEVHPVEPRLGGQLQPVHDRQLLALDLLRDHTEFARQQDPLALRRPHDRR